MEPGGAAARVPRGCSGAGLSARSEEKDQKGMVETEAGVKEPGGAGAGEGEEGGGRNPTVYVGNTGNHESEAPARPSSHAIDRL